jgi:hypothetical protein
MVQTDRRCPGRAFRALPHWRRVHCVDPTGLGHHKPLALLLLARKRELRRATLLGATDAFVPVQPTRCAPRYRWACPVVSRVGRRPLVPHRLIDPRLRSSRSGRGGADACGSCGGDSRRAMGVIGSRRRDSAAAVALAPLSLRLRRTRLPHVRVRARHAAARCQRERQCFCSLPVRSRGVLECVTEACIGCGTAMYCCAAHLQQDLMRKRGHAVTCITAQPMPTFNLASSGMRTVHARATEATDHARRPFPSRRRLRTLGTARAVTIQPTHNSHSTGTGR